MYGDVGGREGRERGFVRGGENAVSAGGLGGQVEGAAAAMVRGRRVVVRRRKRRGMVDDDDRCSC